MTVLHAKVGRGLEKDFILYDKANVVVTPGRNDVVRVCIGREGFDPILTISSAAPTANGSRIDKGSTNYLRIDAQDLTMEPGAYTLSVDYFDMADSAEWKVVQRHVFSLQKVVE